MSSLQRILFVDDDPTSLFLNRRLLARMGITAPVQSAPNGRAALAMLQLPLDSPQESRPCVNLVFVDLNMPVMGGFAFLAAYNQLPPVQKTNTAVVVLTSSQHPQDIQRAHTLLVADFFTKPLTAEMVTKIIETHFSA
jgi:CheY-like chemotaxis protein